MSQHRPPRLTVGQAFALAAVVAILISLEIGKGAGI